MRIQKLDVPWHGLVFCEDVEFSPKHKSAFLAMMFAELDNYLPVTEAIRDRYKDNFMFKILQGRLQSVGSADKVNIYAKAFIASISDTPAKAVMWAYTLNYIYASTKKPVTLVVLTECFPNGLPTDEAMRATWMEQKIDNIHPSKDLAPDASDNWVDSPEGWPKI